MAFHDVDGEAPSIVNASVTRARNYLTAAEVETLMAAARKLTRYGHRDATMILIAIPAWPARLGAVRSAMAPGRA